MVLFTIQNLIGLTAMCVLQAVFGFGSLPYGSVASRRVPAPHRRSVRCGGLPCIV